jgi:hypothetical protein
MRLRVPVLLFSLLFATSLFAKDVYLSISGKANGFFTDARIFNPSYDKDITVIARYLPAGGAAGHPDNSGVAPKSLTIAKRSMAIYDDAVQSMFGGGPALGAIRLTSDDDFVATQRIYADKITARQGGTLGQFVPGLDVTAARRKGVLIQAKSGPSALGNFRTNIGAVNPNAAAVTVTMKLFGKTNAPAGTTKSITLQPFGVIQPTEISGFFASQGADLSDAWLTYESTEPILVWCSVVDNGSEDPTFITASEDTGVFTEPEPEPEPVVTIVAEDFDFDVTISGALRAGKQVRFVLSRKSGSGGHGFRLSDPDFDTVIGDVSLSTTPIQRLVTLPAAGKYSFVCTQSDCGFGHFSMFGDFDVAP